MTDPNGLYYMRARYYHPGLKRFLNRDILPGDVTEGQTFNRFAYVNGDPVGFIDPLGLAGLGTGQCKKGTDKPDDDIIEVNPKDVNFAQVSINRSFDTPNGKTPITKVVKQGPDQVKNFPPISVVNVKGQLVARDGNSRLYVAQKTKAEKIKVRIEKDIESFKDLTKRLRNNGLPNEGTKKPPTPR
ncbi:hypothetical protein EX87_00620 [Brevibacillus laterosporus]|uniref:RHS repeat-associated core domain-containing protein n=2 Tax=Brevibacillus laterosporus TaxID=1465 RepID=A0A0F7EDR4_BRELA|nr:hypothetical protein EX87_00620 [Brevibacillus laterosporus]